MENLFVRARREGIIAFSTRALRFILRRSIGLDWRSAIITERSLEEPIRKIEPRIEVTIRKAIQGDIVKFKGIVDERKLELFKKMFKKNRICFIALDHKKIAYFRWISFEDEYESNCQIRVKLNEKEAYLFDAYTVPQYRQDALHTSVTTKALIYLRNKGYKNVLLLVLNKNVYARKALRRIGFKPKKIITLITLFGLKFHIRRKFKGKL